MKLMPCPMNGPRNIDEFAYLGPATESVDGTPATDAEWAAHLFCLPNPDGLIREFWRHVPSNFIFVVERDTRTDEIVRSYPVGGYRAAEPDGGAA